MHTGDLRLFFMILTCFETGAAHSEALGAELSKRDGWGLRHPPACPQAFLSHPVYNTSVAKPNTECLGGPQPAGRMLLVTPAKRSLPGQFSTPCHPTRNGRGTGWGREVGTSLVDQRAGFQKRRLEEEKPAFNEYTQRPSFRHFQDVPTVCHF